MTQPASSNRPRGAASRAVHSGERPPRPDFVPTATPIYATSSFSYEDSGDLDPIFGAERDGFVYSRYGNPTTQALETVLADLEGGEDAVLCATGMAAIHAAVTLDLKSGDRIVAGEDLYGATFALLTQLLPRYGIEATLVDMRDLDAVRTAVERDKPAVVLFESVSNPLIRVADVAAIAEIGHSVNAVVVVDNTFPSPIGCNPLALGADVVVHSTTKYLAGHGDASGGAIISTRERVQRIRLQQRTIGAVISPFEAWLTLRGVKTLPLRFEKQCANAVTVANWLNQHSRVTHVNFPGLDDLGRAGRQFNQGLMGAMLSFDIAGADEAAVTQFMNALQMIVPATTLGDIYSLVLYPAKTSHRALPPEAQQAIGIGPGLVRLSVGIEDADDIIADIDQALAAMSTT
jgi:cystathionine gamma-synthase/methionine-gamma-lyase